MKCCRRGHPRAMMGITQSGPSPLWAPVFASKAQDGSACFVETEKNAPRRTGLSAEEPVRNPEMDLSFAPRCRRGEDEDEVGVAFSVAQPATGEGKRGETLGMFSIGVCAFHKVHAHLQQRAANTLFGIVVMAMSCRWCLLTSARAETAVEPHKGRMPAGFHHRRLPLLRDSLGSHSCEPKVAIKRFTRREGREPRCSSRAVDGDTEAPADDRHLRNVIVTGANRGLGFAIAGHMLDVGGYRVVLACRSQREGDAALERLRATQEHRRNRGTLPSTLASVHLLDVSHPGSLKSFREDCINGHLGGRVDILFNNAGVCLVEDGGNGEKSHGTGAASAGVLRETLAVNFFGALGVVDACLPALMSAATTPTAVGEETADSTERSASAAARMPPVPPTVVWTSSGDGELCFLGAKWRNLLANAESLEEIKSSMSDLLDSLSASETCANLHGDGDGGYSAATEEQEGEEEEAIAFGPTPAYSLSKAAVNAAVRTWAPRLLRPPPATVTASGRSTGGVVGGVRLVAVCPGDVLTRMTSAEELARGDAVSPEEAAAGVVKIALGSARKFPAGKFYRHGEEIGW